MKDLLALVHCLMIVPVLLVLVSPAMADSGFYVEAGLAYHNTRLDKPEYTARNPLGDLGLGYTFDLGAWGLDLYIKHRSSIPDTEDGIGQNFVGIKLRRYFR